MTTPNIHFLWRNKKHIMWIPPLIWSYVFGLNFIFPLIFQRETNVTVLPEMDYYVQKDTVMDSAILSPRSREMCQGLPVYWMARSSEISGKHYFEPSNESQRQKTHLGAQRICAVCSEPSLGAF